MESKISDIDFCKKYDDETGEYYEEAVGLLETKPIQACQELRKAGEAYCKRLLKYHNVTFKDNRISYLSEILAKNGKLNVGTVKKLDKLRKLCNDKAHSRCEGYSKTFDSLVEEAMEARLIVIDIVKTTFPLVFPDVQVPDFEIKNVDTHKNKDILYEAITSIDPKVKIKAGLLLESIANIQFKTRKSGTQALEYQNNKEIAHERIIRNCNLLNRTAAEFYKSACEISALNKVPVTQYELSEYNFEITARACDVKPLFLYGKILYECNRHGVLRIEGLKYLEIAASRGDADASLVYGEHLYFSKDYKNAPNYLLVAADNDSTYALCLLFYCYSNGLRTDSEIELSLSYLHKAIQLGSADAKAILGNQCIIGRIVQKDIALGKRLLQEAVSEGSIEANRYYHKQQLLIMKEDLFTKILFNAVPDSLQNISRPKRNALCHCGSNKK